MATSLVPASLLLPEGTRLVHIGPPKTGTTTVQSAFHSGRRAIAAEGVHYAGPNRQPVNPVLAVTGRVDPLTGKPPPIRRWHDLVREVTRAGESRVVISSEFFARADPGSIRTIVEDLDPVRTHIVVTLRPLSRILPSQWQQHVQSGMRTSLDAWLEAVFNAPDSNHARAFWYRHRDDALVDRWAQVAGPANVTVVALDEGDASMVLRVFEGLLGLPEGILVPDPDLDNRSMTLPEVEVVRAFNTLFRQEGLGTPLHHMVMRFGATSYMKTRQPKPDEARVEIPKWALDEAGAIAQTMVDSIVASGVRIVGDPQGLTRVPAGGWTDDDRPVPVVTPEIAATAALGVLIAGGLARGRSTRPERPADAPEDYETDPGARAVRATMEPLDVVRVPTIRLIAVLIRRAIARVRDRWDAITRRFRRGT